MDLKFNGTTAIVTGASRGIGLAVVHRLKAEGATVVGAARTTTPELAGVADTVVEVDLASAGAAQAVVDEAVSRHGGVDVLVNNVGAGDVDALALGGFLDTDDDQWRHLMDINLFSAVWASRAALPHLVKSRGSIVNVASINGRIPSTGPVGYSEAKAALIAFGKRLSEEFGPQGVRVNTVSPGPVGTGLWRDADSFGSRVAAANGMTHADFLAAMPSLFGLASDRIVEPEAVAALVSFAASPVSAGMIGSDLVIDAGATKTV
ncbi:SDR family NAD(P)-dependent oxidoreductase [Gordonia sp. MP11Mi]|uniref:3-oxoacyl-[acyl-carrier-protein] reductase FabG n=1 Tax=Gordonia sp. MP11Mi TaxID=3022769 RepID=A0AA97CWX4_9ACTN